MGPVCMDERIPRHGRGITTERLRAFVTESMLLRHIGAPFDAA